MLKHILEHGTMKVNVIVKVTFLDSYLFLHMRLVNCQSFWIDRVEEGLLSLSFKTLSQSELCRTILFRRNVYSWTGVIKRQRRF